MRVSTPATADQVVDLPNISIFYSKPHNLHTKRDAAMLNSRVVGKKSAELHVLTEYPTHYCQSRQPLSLDAIFELGIALRSGRKLNDQEHRSLHAARHAGQLVIANLYAKLQSFDDKPPTQGEAAYYLQTHFADGSLRSWITEYFHRGRGKKALWTVGDSIHADDGRYIDFDLWKNHFKWKPRDFYKPQGIRHLDVCSYTRWVGVDVDNHGDEPITLNEFLARYMALHKLLLAEGIPYLAQVNPTNGSYQLWSPVPKWGLQRVATFAAKVTSTCPWVREIYPTQSKWGIICPLRPDKVNLIGAGQLPRVNCRPKTWCYDLVAAWRWHRKPTMINTDPVIITLGRSFLARSSKAPKVSAIALSEAPVMTATTKPTTKSNARLRTKATTGKFGPLRGRWLELLSETYLDEVEPPVGSVVSMLTPQLRLFREGETELARTFLRDVIVFMRSRCWTFSDRVQNDPDELLRTLDHLCKERTHKVSDGDLKKVDATRKRLDDLGFDGSFASLLKALSARRVAGRASGAVDLPVVENEAITAAACRLMTLTKTDHQAALTLAKRILNHVAQQNELSYSLLKEIAHGMGVRLSNYKAEKVFGILRKRLIIKIKNYSRCPGWSIGNQYAVTDEVQFVTDDASRNETDVEVEARKHDGGTQEISSNYTISRFQTNDVLDMKEIALEVARLRSDKRFVARIRASRMRAEAE